MHSFPQVFVCVQTGRQKYRAEFTSRVTWDDAIARYRQFRRSCMHMHFKIAGAGCMAIWRDSPVHMAQPRVSHVGKIRNIPGLQSGEWNILLPLFIIKLATRKKLNSPSMQVHKLYVRVLKEISIAGSVRHGTARRHGTKRPAKSPPEHLISFSHRRKR